RRSSDLGVEIHVFGGAVREAPGSISPHLIYHGWLNHRDIHENMLKMDAVLIPSRWEGFALTPLEAMRAGRPVIVSNLSSRPEVVINGFNGIVMADYSASSLSLSLSCLTEEECRRMGDNARKVYEDSFTFQGFSERMDAVYKSS